MASVIALGGEGGDGKSWLAERARDPREMELDAAASCVVLRHRYMNRAKLPDTEVHGGLDVALGHRVVQEATGLLAASMTSSHGTVRQFESGFASQRSIRSLPGFWPLWRVQALAESPNA